MHIHFLPNLLDDLLHRPRPFIIRGEEGRAKHDAVVEGVEQDLTDEVSESGHLGLVGARQVKDVAVHAVHVQSRHYADIGVAIFELFHVVLAVVFACFHLRSEIALR